MHYGIALVISGCGHEVILYQPITMIRPYLFNVHTELNRAKQNISGAIYTRGGGSCAGGLPNMKSFRSFTGKGVALKELIYTWNSHVCVRNSVCGTLCLCAELCVRNSRVCVRIHSNIALTHPCLCLESCSCYEIS